MKPTIAQQAKESFNKFGIVPNMGQVSTALPGDQSLFTFPDGSVALFTASGEFCLLERVEED